jgi:hypothetical protein
VLRNARPGADTLLFSLRHDHTVTVKAVFGGP